MKIQVQVEIEIEDNSATDEEIQEWLEYQLGCRGGINMKNPLHDQDIDANCVRYT